MDHRAWTVQGKLGEGGTGVVYLAETPEGTRVAVKALTSRDSALLEHEAKLLIRLRHPHIASFLGYLKDSSPIFGEDRGPSFWMEYVGGDDITAAAVNLPDSEKIERALLWLEQALEALAYLHDQGVLHGDLSPGNIRIDAQGRLKLIDFGMATTGRETGARRAATILYLAPERIGGRNGPACDLFSLGTIFYEILAGIHPRAGCRSLSDMVRKGAAPLMEVRRDWPEGRAVLARVLDRMIVSDPRERFDSARDVLEALRGGLPKTASKGTERIYPMAMVGVEDAFSRMDQALQSVGERSHLLAVRGPTGVGKSRLLREFSFACALAGLAIHETSSLSALQEPGMHYLRNVEKWNEASLAELFRLRRSSLPPRDVLVVMEWNDDRLSEAARRLLARLVQHPDVEDIRLGNLARPDADDLARMILGADPGNDVLSFLYEQSSGNPLMILEIVGLIRERGAWSPEKLSGLKNLKTVDDVLSQRLAGVTDQGRRLLLLLAAAHYPVGLDEYLRAIAEQSPPEGDVFEHLTLLDDLIAKGFVARDEENGAYRLAMPSIERHLLDQAGPQLSQSHEIWWKIVSAVPDSLPQRAHHAISLRDAAETARSSLPAAEFLIQRGERGEALSLIEKAVAVLETADESVALSRLYRAQVNLLSDLGRFPEALEVLEKAMALAAADEPLDLKRAKYWVVSGLMHQHLGNFPEAVRRFREALSVCESSGDESLRPYRVRAHSLLGLRALDGGQIAEAKARFEQAIAEDRENGRRRAEILRNLATALAHEKDWPGAERALENAVSIYRREDYAAGEFAARLLEGNIDVQRGDPAAAEKAYAEAEDVAAKKKDDLLLAMVWNNQGTLARKKGDLAAAREKVQRGLDVFRALGNWDHLVESLKQSVLTEAECGHFAAAERLIGEMRRLVARFPSAAQKADEAELALAEYRDGPSSPAAAGVEAPALKPDDSWNQENLLRRLTREAKDTEKIRQTLNAIFEKLPHSLKVSFADRADYKRWISGPSSPNSQGGRA